MIPEISQHPKVSIIIACYNDPDVGRAVSSAYDQTYLNKEIIVVNDGSDNATVAALESVSDYIDIRIDQDNKGQSIARNIGIKNSTGKYILNHDSDDFFDPKFCNEAVTHFEKDDDIVIVTCQAKRFSKKGEIDIYTPQGGAIKDFLFANSAMGSSMFKKDDWDRVGGYEEKLPILGIEDWEFYINLLKYNGYAFVIQKPLFNYQLREDSSTVRIRELKYDKYKYIIEKHRDLYNENFDELVSFFTERLKLEQKEKIKNTNRIEYRLGHLILRPLRYLKSFIK
jgi:glycosyltransferase involved in cell wall biosynthesis